MYTHDTKKVEDDIFELEIPNFMSLRFKFTTLQLNKLYWRDYIDRPNPVAAALITRMQYSEKEKVELKLTFYDMLRKLNLTEKQNRFLIAYMETYLILSEDQEKKFKEKSEQKGGKNSMDFITSFEKKAKEEGRAEGRQEGRAEGRVEGHQEGREAGREEGRVEEKENIARILLKKDYSLEEVNEVTHLPIERIRSLA